MSLLQSEIQAKHELELLDRPDVLEAMAIRCREEGRHEWQNCMTAFLKVYQECRWCGERQQV